MPCNKRQLKRRVYVPSTFPSFLYLTLSPGIQQALCLLAQLVRATVEGPRGQGCESRTRLNFFQAFLCVYNCDDLLWHFNKKASTLCEGSYDNS